MSAVKGVKLNHLISLLHSWELGDKSCREVVEEHIKPLTVDQQCSYLEYLSSDESTLYAVKDANIFVSHVWVVSFVEVITAISRWVGIAGKCMEEVVIWMDMFCSSQHLTVELDFVAITTTFHHLLEKIHYVLVYLAPWDNPIPFERSWCLWEIYLALKLNCEVHLVFSDKEEQEFASDLSKYGIESIKRLIAAVDSRKGQSTHAEDMKILNQYLDKHIGFENLNKLVHTSMQQSLINILIRIIDKEENEKVKGWLLSGLASLYCFHGKLEEAAKTCGRSIQLLRNTSNETLYEQILLGKIYIQLGNYEKALNIFDSCNYQISKVSLEGILDITFPDFIELRNPFHLFVEYQKGKSEVLIKFGRYEDAERMLRGTLETLKMKIVNDYNPLLGGLSNLLIESYEKQGKFDLAEGLYDEYYRVSSESFSENHPDTLASLYKLSTHSLYRDPVNLENAFRHCLTKQQSSLPKDHPDTLRTALSLAVVLTKMSRYEEAEVLFRGIIESTRSFNHYEVLLSYGRCLMEQGKLTDAETFLKETLVARERELGVTHPDTLIAMKQVVDFYQACGATKEAAELNQQYISLRRASLTAFLPDDDNFLGIKLSDLERFHAKYGDGFVTSRDMKPLILAETREAKCSYCKMLQNIRDTSVGKATVFVSHSWGNSFVRLLAILRHHFSSLNEAERDPYLWIDLFSFNQHITNNFNFFRSIEAVIANTNNTVMVFEAWNAPLPLTRAWCIWELYCTIDTNSRFTIAFGEEKEVKVSKAALEQLLDSIDCEKSQCEFERDRIRIYETILRSITFPKLNRLVKEVIKERIIRSNA